MKKSLFIFALFLFTSFTQAWAYSVSYTQKVLVDKDPVATIKVVNQDENLRAESDFNGMSAIMIRNATGIYSWLPEQKVVTKLPAEMDKPNITRDLPKFMDFLNKNNGKKIGSETKDGKELDIYTFLEPNIQKEGKVWIWREKQFPVRIEVKADEGVTIVELSDINFSPAIEAAAFEIPKDLKILDLSAKPAAIQAEAAPAQKKAAPAAKAKKKTA